MPDRSRTDLPDHVTTPLLELLVANSLDRDYAAAAAARAERGARPTSTDGETGRQSGEESDRDRRGGGWTTVLVAVGIFGLLVGISFGQTRSNAADALANRSSLIERIEASKKSNSAQQDRLGRLRATNQSLEQRVAQTEDEVAAARERVTRLQTRTGFSPVRGPGVRIIVNDPEVILDPDRDQVRDSDLALLVDGLWNVGAEAIAINGHRLTALTAIRNSSVAIHVGIAPLSPPYRVEAIGDIRTLQARLMENSRGAAFFNLAQSLRFRVTRENVEELRLPGAQARALRYAEPLDETTHEDGETTP